MCFNMDASEECLYCGLTTRCKFCLDCDDTWDSQFCYDSVELYNSYNCDFSQFLRDCSDCNYSYDLLNCHNCFGCVGLRRANFYIFNEPYEEEEYKKRLAALKEKPREEIIKKVNELRLNYPHLASRQYKTENCFGDNIQNSRNCFYSFNTKGMHDGAYLYDMYNVYGERSKDTYDSYFSVDLHHCYENVQVGDGYNCNFCHRCEHIRDSEFCDLCFHSKNLFGCLSINRREYLILNQPYQKEQWHKLTSNLRESLIRAKSYGWNLFESPV